MADGKVTAGLVLALIGGIIILLGGIFFAWLAMQPRLLYLASQRSQEPLRHCRALS